MKKSWIIGGGVIAIIAIYFLFFFNEDKSENAKLPKQQPLAQNKNNETFNAPFNKLLDKYFDLKNAFVEWDTVQINKDAKQLQQFAGEAPYHALQADSVIIQTAKSFSDNIAAECGEMIAGDSIEEKRHSFYTLSENLYNLLRTVKYDQQVIYHDKCPMAFNDNEAAYWLSSKREIVNPYFGNKHPHYKSGMLSCGSIEDSIDYQN